MTVVTDEILQQVVDIIVREIRPEQIVLFGSQARRAPSSFSDLDLLVVDSTAFGPDHSRIRELSRIERALSGVIVPTDILVYSRDEIERWRHSPGHIIAQALREGRVLYERS